MLKTNSRKARENVKAYILSDIDYIKEYAAYYGKSLDESNPDMILAYCFSIFQGEKRVSSYDRSRPEYVVFKQWASGLACGQLFMYYYNKPAVDVLGAILEESESEKSRYTESQAEELLTRLIYRELKAAAEK